MVNEIFKRITGYDPYPHQIEIFEALSRGESVILRAPTGSGKSEAVFIPFLELRGRILPKRMIYSLPMRALVNSLHERFQRYGVGLDVRAQHGSRPETVLFDADGIVATLDQVITSYACAPLNLGVRHGNLPAGAVASSFHVFDEVHTFEPLLGLQSSLILAERMKNLGLPFVIMSATLPSLFAKSLSQRFGARIIDAEEEAIYARKRRMVSLRLFLDQELSADVILDIHNSRTGKTIVVCNTVGRATALYSELRNKITPAPILIHSRYFDNDKAKKETFINKLFGKNSRERTLLISTQVIEVGMDISCDLLITELAPIDALIQRAGRCARWGGEGEIMIFEVSHPAPYEESLVEKTEFSLKKYQNHMLTWELEKQLVDEVLNEAFGKFGNIEAGAKAMMHLSRAAFEGNPAEAEKAVREALVAEVSIHNNPELLESKVLLLPRCKVHPGTLKKFFGMSKPRIWRIEEDRIADDDYRPQVEAIILKREKDIRSGGFYVIHNDFAFYDPEEGFIFGKKGTPLEPVDFQNYLPQRGFVNIPMETWKAHALRTLEVFEKKLLPQENFIYKKLASYLGLSEEKLIHIIRLVLLLHDLGKLTEEWQEKIGAGKEFLAHSGNLEKCKLPPHATVSAYILGDYFREEWRGVMGNSAFLAIAHHHSARAAKVPKYRLCDGWFEEVNEILLENIGMKLRWEVIKDFAFQESNTILSSRIPAFEKEKAYNFYLILSRTLRLADRWATESVTKVMNNL